MRSYRLFAREVIPHFTGPARRAPGVARLGRRQAGRALRRAPARPSSTPSPSHVEEGRPRAQRPATVRRGQLMRAAGAARAASWSSATTCPSPCPDFGQVLVQVKACGICGSDLHFAKHGATMLAPGDGDGGHCPTSAAPPTRPRPRRVHGPRVLRRGARGRARHRRPGAGHDRHVDPDPAHDRRACAPSSTATTSPPATASACCCRRRCSSEVPNGLDPRHAALTEPMAVGLHAVNRSGIAAGDGALVLGCGPVGLAVIAALRLQGIEPIVAADFSPARRALATVDGRPRGRRPGGRAGLRRLDAGRPGPGRSSCSRPSACPASSTTRCAWRRRRAASWWSACAWSPTRSRRSSGSARS